MPEELYMQRAIRLARLGLGRTSPNPMVGAVIVKNGRIINTAAAPMRSAAHWLPVPRIQQAPRCM